MSNLDLKKTLKYLYLPSKKDVSVVAVPPMNYLMIDGKGNPNTSEQYQQSVVALYKLAYAIRAIQKTAGQIFTVMPLEGLWWFEGNQIENFRLTDSDKDRFIWTLMILQPEMISQDIVKMARDDIRKKKDAPALLDDVRFEAYDEGEAVQIMHVGSYDAEGPAINRLHDHITSNEWALNGKHHEIYLNDPRKVTSDKLKTIIRQPFKRI